MINKYYGKYNKLLKKVHCKVKKEKFSDILRITKCKAISKPNSGSLG